MKKKTQKNICDMWNHSEHTQIIHISPGFANSWSSLWCFNL